MRLELDGVERGLEILREIRRRGQHLGPVMDQIGAYLLSRTLIGIEREHAPSGAPWLPTLRGGRILRDTGRLAASITYIVGRDFVEVGTNTLYAAAHQFGAETRAKNAPYLVFKTPRGGFVRKAQVTIPARPFIGFAPQDGAEIERIAGDYLGGIGS